VTTDEWCPREDGRRGAAPIKRDGMDASVTTFIVALTEPTRSLARVTIRQTWGGQWSIVPGRIWPADEDGDGA
jgi:hypothetical protein